MDTTQPFQNPQGTSEIIPPPSPLKKIIIVLLIILLLTGLAAALWMMFFSKKNMEAGDETSLSDTSSQELLGEGSSAEEVRLTDRELLEEYNDNLDEALAELDLIE